jgi:hypothetical protein
MPGVLSKNKQRPTCLLFNLRGRRATNNIKKLYKQHLTNYKTKRNYATLLERGRAR